MKEFLEILISNLVDDKQAIKIEMTENDNLTTFEVSVAKDEMGKVIGKQGRIAKSIRTIMESLAAKEHKRVRVEFVG